MHINRFKKAFQSTACLFWLAIACIFSMNVFAEDVSSEDIDAAYNYYSQVAPGSSSAQKTHRKNHHMPPKTTTPAPAQPVPTGIGGVAVNLMQPVTAVSGLLSGMAIVIGMACLFASFVRYMQHRVNPLAHPISTVVTLLVLGLILVLLPLIYKFTESGVPFSL